MLINKRILLNLRARRPWSRFTLILPSLSPNKNAINNPPTHTSCGRNRRTNSIKEQDPDRILWPDHDLLLLYLHRGFEGGVQVGGLDVFVCGRGIGALHGGGAVYAEEDHVAFGVEELWEGVSGFG